MDHRENLIRHLMDTVRCSVCSASYHHDNVSVLGHQDELWFLTVTCPDCRTQGLIAALVRGEETSAVGSAETTARDRSVSREPVRPSPAAATGPITEADVADMHDFLSSHRGDLASLLGTR